MKVFVMPLLAVACAAFSCMPLSAMAQGGAKKPAEGSSGAGSACHIDDVSAPSMADKQLTPGQGVTYNGTWVHVGSVYHFGALSVRVNRIEDDGRYNVDIKAPGYSDNWSIANSGQPATFKACGVDVSLAIVRGGGPGLPDAFTVGSF